MRLYTPKAAALDGRWNPPAVERVVPVPASPVSVPQVSKDYDENQERQCHCQLNCIWMCLDHVNNGCLENTAADNDQTNAAEFAE